MNKQTNTQLKLLRVDEVAEILQTTPRTVRQYISHNQLNAYRLPNNGGYRVHRSDLDHFLDGLKIG